MSDLNIRLNLDTTAAEAGAAEVKDDLAKLRTEGERPVRVNVDRSQLDAAAGGAGRLREALGNVQAAALGELSQKAGQLGASLGGVAGSVAEVAIKSAAAFGPIGIAITAVLAGLALVKQAVDENNAATERSDAISSSLAEANNTLGGSYSTVVAAANAATTAQAARLAVAQQEQAIIQRQIAIMGQAGTAVGAAGLDLAFQRISDSTKTSATSFALLTREMVANLVHTGTSAQQQAFLGQSFNRSTVAVVAFRQEIELTKRVLADQAANALRAAMAARTQAAEQVRDAQQRVNANSSDIAAVRDLNQAQARLDAVRQNLRTVTAAYTASQRELGTATRDTTQATREAEEEEQALASARRLIERQNAARAAAASAETGAQRRAGMEALRVAEQGLLTAGQEISVSEQLTRAEQALAFATGETTRARAASARGGQTTAERTALVSALNAEATARQGVADALERQANAQRDLKSNQIDIEAKEQTESNRAFAEWARNRNTVNQEYLDRQTTAAAAFTEKKRREDEREKAAAEKLANEVKTRNDQLAGSAGKLGEAQIAAAFAAAIAGENAGVAMQAALKASLLALSQEAAIKSLYKLAEGFGYAATPGMQANAAAAFTSAGIFAGVAAAAGVGGALIPSPAAAPTGAAGGATAGAGAGAGATPMRSGGGGASEAPKNITINFSAFQSNEQAQALIVRSLREAGYNGRARVGSSFSSERR